MTQQEAYERLIQAIYAAVFNSDLVDEALEIFGCIGIRVTQLALTMHVTTEALTEHRPGRPSAPAQFVPDVAHFDMEFLKRMNIGGDLSVSEGEGE